MEKNVLNNMTAPILSVIVPVYNVEEFLGECVDSILVQTFEDYELILVDDGSTDSSGQICDRYASLDQRVFVIHKENGGLSSARNAGLDVAKGEYVTFIDSDDVIVGYDVYEKVMAEFAVNPDADVVQYDVLFKYQSAHQHKRNYPFKKYRGKEAILSGYLSQQIHVSFCDKVFRREALEDVRFPIGQISEDIATIPDLIENINVLVTANIGYYGYRYREGSISRSAMPYKKILSVLDSYYRYLSYAVSFRSLRAQAITLYVNTFWGYLSEIRTHYPEELKDFYRQKIFIKISILEYLKNFSKFTSKNRIQTFALCVVGPRVACLVQRLFTHGK